MAYLDSPGVNIKEVDLTSSIPTGGVSNAAFVGSGFTWGPIDEVKTISSETELLNVFGPPSADEDEAIDWFTIASFLAYGGSVQVLRGETGGGSGQGSATWKSSTTPEDVQTITITASHKGIRGNKIEVNITKSSDSGKFNVEVLEGEITREYYEAASTEDIVSTLEENSSLITMTIPEGIDSQPEADLNVKLANGEAGTAARSWDKFATGAYEVDLLIGGQNSSGAAGIAESLNALALISPEKASTTVESIKDDIVVNSHTAMDSGWKKMYDKYNGKFVTVPLNGDIAGLCVRTDNTREPWFSPAGLDRGQIKNVVSLTNELTQEDRDKLYKANINPVVSMAGKGTVLFGDKTTQAKKSAMDRINVRRLFNVIQKQIGEVAQYSLFEFNDEFTRSQFRSIVVPYLRNIQSGRGINNFMVVCDESNNTPSIIDSNQFVADIFIKPNRSVNFIQLNLVAVNTGVSFTEVTGAV
tara:strand:+ start:41 stop:1456 length:1416 start_codon:yes stop_codon:yes gene_type:complete